MIKKVKKVKTRASVPGPAPTRGGPSEELLVERASASPLSMRLVTGTQKKSPSVRPPPVRASLRALQSWFTNVIMHPDSEAAGVQATIRNRELGLEKPGDVERVVTAGPQCSVLERLHVYHYAYHARLIECLTDDFPSLVYALGAAEFEKLARAVIRFCPSQTPDLNRYGAQLINYLQRHPKACRQQRFITDLARLEWAMVEVLHAQAAPVLALAELQQISTDQWESVVFTPSATAQVVHFAYPVNAFLQAFRDERRPPLPKRSPSATAVYRQGYTVWRMDLSQPMAAILDALWSGKTLGESLQTLAVTTSRAEQPAVLNQVMTWFSEWVQGGFFARCHHSQ